MPLPYSVHLRQEAFEFLQSRKKREREEVLGFLRQLASNPFVVGDFEENDDTGRPIQGVILGRFGIYFWADHAVSELRVIAIRSADR